MTGSPPRGAVALAQGLRAGATSGCLLWVTVTAVHLGPAEKWQLLDPTHLVGLSHYLMFDGMRELHSGPLDILKITF